MDRDSWRDSWLLMGGALFLAVIGIFVVFWIVLKAIYAFGFLAVIAVLLLLVWLYDRREKRARAGLPPV